MLHVTISYATEMDTIICHVLCNSYKMLHGVRITVLVFAACSMLYKNWQEESVVKLI